VEGELAQVEARGVCESSGPRSVLERLRKLPDGRRRHGRIRAQVVVLAKLLAGALEGESSLHGIWKRGHRHWQALRERVGVDCKWMVRRWLSPWATG